MVNSFRRSVRHRRVTQGSGSSLPLCEQPWGCGRKRPDLKQWVGSSSQDEQLCYRAFSDKCFRDQGVRKKPRLSQESEDSGLCLDSRAFIGQQSLRGTLVLQGESNIGYFNGKWVHA